MASPRSPLDDPAKLPTRVPEWQSSDHPARVEVKPGPDEFRHVLGHWSTGVAVVATLTPAGTPCGLTANAVAAVSLDPPLVLACVERGADTHDALLAAGVFSINVLAHGSEGVARRFASDDAPAKFRELSYRTEVSGAPVLDDALAWIDCSLHAAHDGGDHTIFVGAVLAAGAVKGEPMLYYRGRYVRLPG